MKLKDRLWLWGHGRQIENVAGKPLNLHGRPGIGKLSCAEAAREMGIPNLCRIVIEPMEQPPFDGELEEARDMGRSSGRVSAAASWRQETILMK